MVVTHQDWDYAGALREVVELTGAVVYTYKRDAPYVDDREHPIKSPVRGSEWMPGASIMIVTWMVLFVNLPARGEELSAGPPMGHTWTRRIELGS